MQFIKQNLFLAIVVAVVLVVGGFMVFMSTSVAKDVNAEVAKRNQVAQQLERVAKSPVNPQKLKAEEQQVQSIQQAAQEIKQACIDWNRRNYAPLELDIAGQKVSAFPYENNAQFNIAQYSLAFTGKYIAELQAMVAALKPTAAPSQADITAHGMQWQNQLQQDQEEQGQPSGGPAGRTGAARLSVRPGAALESRSQGLSDEAKRRGRQSAVMARAMSGQVYLDMANLDRVYPYPVHDGKPEELWFTQLNLWITRDILEAIRQTNEEAFNQRGAAANQRVVPNAAVKRLMSLNIDENYVAAPSQRPGSAAGTPAPTVTPRAPQGMDMMQQYLEMERAEAAAEEQAEAMEALPSGLTVKGQRTAEGLTQRGCTADYDVIYYDFTVVIPSRYVLALQRNLMAQNYHAIRNIKMTQVDMEKGSTQVKAEGHADYYYGPDDVMEVKIEGELLLLTDWERGTHDPASGAWTLPALMPVEVLKAAFPENSTALRDADRTRMGPIEPKPQPGAAAPRPPAAVPAKESRAALLEEGD